MIYDLIIVGAGPAGMTAAIYAARRKIKFLMLSMDIGGQVNWSSEVDNYPGLPDFTGIEVVESFKKHLDNYKIKITNTEIIQVKKKGKLVSIKTNKKEFQSKAAIIVTGKKPKKLNVKGEEEMLGKGVTYCATCDAPLYKNKIVSVIGGGNSGLEAGLFLSKYAKKVYIIDFLEKLGGEAYLRDEVAKNKKISFIGGSKIKEIYGSKFVEGLKYETGKVEKDLKLQGVFIEIGLTSNTDFIKNIKKNKWGEIMIFRSTKSHEENMTSIPGIFAAGDVTDIPDKQIIVAAGEGAKAALASFNYIDKWKE
jgi:NADH-dependent peroxiredoxin subunit F